MAGRIFISYSKEEPEPTKKLAAFLEAEGYSVWWDTHLTAGEVFRTVIDRELDNADAVIVVWTPHSVSSNWVISEADHGNRKHKLITTRTQDVEAWRIPKPYDTYHTNVVSDHAAILAAVQRVAGTPAKPSPPSPRLDLSEHTVREALALEYWQSIKASGDAARLRAFLAEFGSTGCAALARDMLQRLENEAWARLPRRRDQVALETFLAQGWDGEKAALARAEFASLRDADTARRERMQRHEPPPAPRHEPAPIPRKTGLPPRQHPVVSLPIVGVVLYIVTYVAIQATSANLWTLNPFPALVVSVLLGFGLWRYGGTAAGKSCAAAAVIWLLYSLILAATVGAIRQIVAMGNVSQHSTLLMVPSVVSAIAYAAAIMAVGAAVSARLRRATYWIVVLILMLLLTILTAFLGPIVMKAGGYSPTTMVTIYFALSAIRQVVALTCICYWLAQAPPAPKL